LKHEIATPPLVPRDDEVGDVEQAGEPLFNICAHPVLRHRLVTSFAAEAEGVTTDDLVDRLLAEAGAFT